MKIRNQFLKTLVVWAMPMLFMVSCGDILDESLENEALEGQVDYTISEDMELVIYGAYGELNFLQWETFPVIAVRGDDVNAAGDQFPLIETDEFRYDRSFWMYNSAWQNLYTDVVLWNSSIEVNWKNTRKQVQMLLVLISILLKLK